MDHQDFGARIRKIRKDRKMTQEQLAEQLNISPSFLGHVERGTRTFSLDMTVEVCRVLKVGPEVLLRGSLPEYTPEWSEDGTNNELAHARKVLRMVQNAIEYWEE
ncbi:MAG: helix-turn-helix transcriptional regulator [Clostridiales bacterium]|nr:helix-turn-helix transcriptional regulator [Clostridiales bacterium]